MGNREEKMNCKLGPTPTGSFLDLQMSLMDYEIMCKQAVEGSEGTKFCDCENNVRKQVSTEASQNVI